MHLAKSPPSAQFEGTVKMTQWLQKLNTMRAVDEISDDESETAAHGTRFVLCCIC